METKRITADIYGKEREIVFDVDVNEDTFNYGSDSDGNRGELKTEISIDYCNIWLNEIPMRMITDLEYRILIYRAIDDWIEENSNELKPFKRTE